MRRTLPPLAGGAIVALALIAAAGDARAENGVAPVTVQNPVTVANQVTAAAIAKTMGVQHPTAFDVSADSINGELPYQVPANQRLIIEFASGTCLITYATLNFVELEFVRDNNLESSVVLNIPATKVTETTNLNFGELVRIYVDPGTTLHLLPAGGVTVGGQLACAARFSGQLIDVP
jgi:hypothetical protein